MKGYKRFISVLVLLLALYIVAEVNRPKPVNWTVTLSKEDKAPYGSYILYQQLKNIFPHAVISSFRQPPYEQVNNFADSNTAYLMIEPDAAIKKADLDELLNYVVIGNYAFIASDNFSKELMDTLKFKTGQQFSLAANDSLTINFTNPVLRADSNYGLSDMTMNAYFSKLDTSKSIVLGNNLRKDINFIKIPYGDGAFFIHTAPLCFSNYFMLTKNNISYTAQALSYLPANVKQVYWDEFYKLGAAGSGSPFRFLLSNTWFRWAFRISLFSMILFVLFEMKRKQRIIPVIEPPRNSSLDFVQTVGGVYFNQHDNKNIALKKISYFLEFVRSGFYINTNDLNEAFIQALAKKSGVGEQATRQLTDLIYDINASQQITDHALLQLSNQIDSFYEKAK